MGVYRSQLIAVYEKVMDGISNGNRVNVEGQLDFFGMGGGAAQREPLHLPDHPEFSAQERMAMEKETTGLYLSVTRWTLTGSCPAGSAPRDWPHSGGFCAGGRTDDLCRRSEAEHCGRRDLEQGQNDAQQYAHGLRHG